MLQDIGFSALLATVIHNLTLQLSKHPRPNAKIPLIANCMKV